MADKIFATKLCKNCAIKYNYRLPKLLGAGIKGICDNTDKVFNPHSTHYPVYVVEKTEESVPISEMENHK